jgi:RimJ/RimL family protein N-acetyltransferase
MVLETERLILRAWEEADAAECFRYAQDPRVGDPCGWRAHKDAAESRRIIRDVLAVPETYAIVLRETGLPVGSIGLHRHTDNARRDDEAELGYWLGVPYWGRGLVPEAARQVLRHAFEELGLARVWCAYFDGNEKSKRVQEKLGFRFGWTTEGLDVPQMGEKRTGHVNFLTKNRWEWLRMRDAAEAVRRERRISEYVTCGEVSAAIMSASGRIYTGICVDTASTLGICAERNALFHMLTSGEQTVRKVLAILPDGRSGAPCGACRELLVQLMPTSYKDIEIMMDLDEDRVVTLGELTPEWWIRT